MSQPPEEPQGPMLHVPPPKPRNPKRIAIVTICVALVLAAIVFVLVRATGDDDESSPESVAKEFIDAFREQDCDRMVDLMTGELKDQADSGLCEDGTELGGDALGSVISAADIEIEKVEEDGDEADVTVSIGAMGFSVDTVVEMVKNGDDWLVSSFDLGSLGNLGGITDQLYRPSPAAP